MKPVQPVIATILRHDSRVTPAISGLSNSADGFVVIHEMRSPRRSTTYPPVLQSTLQKAIRAIVSTLKQPIQYAGPEQASLLSQPLMQRCAIAEFGAIGNIAHVPIVKKQAFSIEQGTLVN